VKFVDVNTMKRHILHAPQHNWMFCQHDILKAELLQQIPFSTICAQNNDKITARKKYISLKLLVLNLWN